MKNYLIKIINTLTSITSNDIDIYNSYYKKIQTKKSFKSLNYFKKEYINIFFNYLNQE